MIVSKIITIVRNNYVISVCNIVGISGLAGRMIEFSEVGGSFIGTI